MKRSILPVVLEQEPYESLTVFILATLLRSQRSDLRILFHAFIKITYVSINSYQINITMWE
jgi:hypothetical protein